MNKLLRNASPLVCIGIAVLLAIIGPAQAFADETVETTDGRQILLKSDGTYQIIPKAATKAADALVISFEGRDMKNTRPFATKGPWEMQWDAQGEIFQAFLYTDTGALVGVPANQQGAGKGASYQPRAGKYYLQINAMGPWHVDIVHVQ